MSAGKSLGLTLLTTAVVGIITFVLGLFIKPIRSEVIHLLNSHLPAVIIVAAASFLIVGTGFYIYYHDKVSNQRKGLSALEKQCEQLKQQRNSYSLRCQNLMEEYSSLEQDRGIQNALRDTAPSGKDSIV